MKKFILTVLSISILSMSLAAMSEFFDTTAAGVFYVSQTDGLTTGLIGEYSMNGLTDINVYSLSSSGTSYLGLGASHYFLKGTKANPIQAQGSAAYLSATNITSLTLTGELGYKFFLKDMVLIPYASYTSGSTTASGTTITSTIFIFGGKMEYAMKNFKVIPAIYSTSTTTSGSTTTSTTIYCGGAYDLTNNSKIMGELAMNSSSGTNTTSFTLGYGLEI